MNDAQIIIQTLAVIVTVIGAFQKEKWKIMLFHALTNAIYVAMFFVFGRVASALICVVAVIKNLLYMFFSYKKIEPKLLVFISFITVYILITIFSWQDAYDILPLIAMLASNYGAWQDSIFILRFCYIINGLSYFIYKLLIGAYIAVALEGVNLLFTIICFIYYCILKREKPILQVVFRRKQSQKNDVNPENIQKDDLG